MVLTIASLFFYLRMDLELAGVLLTDAATVLFP